MLRLTGKIPQLAGKIRKLESLAQDVQRQKISWENDNEELFGLRRKQPQLEEKVTNLETQKGEWEEKETNLNAKVEELKNEKTNLETKNRALDAELKRAEKMCHDNANSYDQLDEKFKKLE